jgi:hypothetical protein
MAGMNTASFDRQCKALQAGLGLFRDSIQRKIARSALQKGMRVVNKAVKSEVPGGPLKIIKKFIGMRLLKRAAGQEIAGKVGVGVGKGASKKIGKKDRANRPGVGIGPQNVHWFILGTKPRYQGVKTTRNRKTGEVTSVTRTAALDRYTGIMPPQVPDIVKAGFEKSYSQALRVIIKATEEGIQKEAAKILAAVKAAM